MKPVFTAVIPVYNGEKFIARAIESALKQEYSPHEVIVVDDGSTDGTPEILRSFGNKIRSKRIQNSGGASRPRNIGIEMSTGDYIAFLDADDFWFRHKLKMIAEYIAKYPDIRFFSSDHIERSDATRHRLARHSSLICGIPGVCFDEPLKSDPVAVLLQENFVGTPSGVVVKKTLFETAGLFNDVYRMAEDLEFYLRAALSDNFLIVNDVLFFKYDHPENMSAQKLQLYGGHRNVLVNFCDGYYKALKLRGLLPYCGKALANLDYIIGNVHFEAGFKGQAFSFYKQALTDSPTPSNFKTFLKTVVKKGVRVITFDKLSRKSLGY